MDLIWTKFNCMVDGSKVTAQCKLCLNAQSNYIGRMKKRYEKCVKQPRSSEPQPSTASEPPPSTASEPQPSTASEPQPSTASEPQQDAVCDPAPVLVSQTMPAQQAKRPAALQFGPDSPPAKKRQTDLNSHVVWTPATTKDDLPDCWVSVWV